MSLIKRTVKSTRVGPPRSKKAARRAPARAKRTVAKVLPIDRVARKKKRRAR